jgi:hypothetical protein
MSAGDDIKGAQDFQTRANNQRIFVTVNKQSMGFRMGDIKKSSPDCLELRSRGPDIYTYIVLSVTCMKLATVLPSNVNARFIYVPFETVLARLNTRGCKN